MTLRPSKRMRSMAASLISQQSARWQKSISASHSPCENTAPVGIEGLMEKGGELAEPIREATIASTLQRLLLDIAAVGADLEWLPDGTGGVTLVIPDVALSGS